MADLQFHDDASSLKATKKVEKTKVTKSLNKLNILLNDYPTPYSEIENEFHLFNKSTSNARKILHNLQELYSDDEEQLDKLIDEERALRTQYRLISKEVRSIFESKYIMQRSYQSAFSVTQALNFTSNPELNQESIIRTSTPVNDDLINDPDDAKCFKPTITVLDPVPKVSIFKTSQVKKDDLPADNTNFIHALKSHGNDKRDKNHVELTFPQKLKTQLTDLSTYFTPWQTSKKKCQDKYLKQDEKENIAPKNIIFNSEKPLPLSPRLQKKPTLQATVQIDHSSPTSQPIIQSPPQPIFIQAPTYHSAMKLQPIEIAPFDGKFVNWETFRDSFEALIHRVQMSGIEKYYRLKQLLTGSAESFIVNVPISEDSYQAVWDDIKNYYNNPRRIVTSHVESLMNIKSVKNEKPQDLRLATDSFKNHLRALKSADEQSNAEIFKIQLLLSKVDIETRKKWEAKMSTRTELPSLDDLYMLIEKRIRILEVSSNDDRKFVTHMAVGNFNKNAKCYFCSHDHLLYYCESFRKLTSNQKLDFVNEKQLCWNCLKFGHSAIECTSGACKEKSCDEKHNTWLHEAFCQKQ